MKLLVSASRKETVFASRRSGIVDMPNIATIMFKAPVSITNPIAPTMLNFTKRLISLRLKREDFKMESTRLPNLLITMLRCELDQIFPANTRSDDNLHA